jgi:hypothetical protein
MASKLTERIELRCTRAQLRRWKAAAKADGRPLSSWIRRQLEWIADNTRPASRCDTLPPSGPSILND